MSSTVYTAYSLYSGHPVFIVFTVYTTNIAFTSYLFTLFTLLKLLTIFILLALFKQLGVNGQFCLDIYTAYMDAHRLLTTWSVYWKMYIRELKVYLCNTIPLRIAVGRHLLECHNLYELSHGRYLRTWEVALSHEALYTTPQKSACVTSEIWVFGCMLWKSHSCKQPKLCFVLDKSFLQVSLTSHNI